MRFKVRHAVEPVHPDMTPMIDMTFQLIAFFMVVISFSEAEQNERIRLPSSVLAKPPESAVETPVTLQLTDVGTVLFGGDEVAVEALPPLLARERAVIERLQKDVTAATVIVRADMRAKAGVVQQLIRLCQESGFEKFNLRAKQQERAG